MVDKPKARVISLSEIHRRTGLCLAHVSKIYSGQRTPSVAAARLIATAQKMTIDEALASIQVEVNRKRKQKSRAAA